MNCTEKGWRNVIKYYGIEVVADDPEREAYFIFYFYFILILKNTLNIIVDIGKFIKLELCSVHTFCLESKILLNR